MIKAIFFDFNGVIIDDEPLQLEVYKEVLRDQGIDLSDKDYYGALGLDDKGFVRAAFARANKPLSDEILNMLMEEKTLRHRKLIEAELPLFPGVVTFLKSASRSFSIGLVSMATPDEIHYTLDRALLTPLFSVIISTEDAKETKPSPECYQVGLEKLNNWRHEQRLLPVLAGECLAIEDSPPGMQAAGAAGMRTLGVTNTVTEPELRAAGAEVVTRSLADWSVDAVRHVFS